MKKLVPILILILFSLGLHAQEPLVDGAWLKEKLGSKGLYILDIQNPGYYKRYHVPGAVNAPYSIWRTDNKAARAGMRPSKERMEQILGLLGMSNDSLVVIVATGMGAGDMAAAGRVFWTLKSVGHEKVTVLNGGLAAYANRFGGKLESQPNSPPPTDYKVKIDNSFTADAATVQAAMKSGTQLLDARSLGEHVGIINGGDKQRPGTIPGSKHLPFDWFVGDDGFIRDKKAATTLFKASDLNPAGDGTIHYCQSGNRASLSWFVDYAVLGNKKAKLYDASMGEWGADKALPLDTKIKL